MKKILAIVLAVVMLLPVFAVNVFAETVPELGVQVFAQSKADWSYKGEGFASVKLGETLNFKATSFTSWAALADTAEIIFRIDVGDRTLTNAGDSTTIGYTVSDVTIKATGYDDYVVPGATITDKVLTAEKTDWGLSGTSDNFELVLAENPWGSDSKEHAKYLAAITEISFDLTFDSHKVNGAEPDPVEPDPVDPAEPITYDPAATLGVYAGGWENVGTVEVSKPGEYKLTASKIDSSDWVMLKSTTDDMLSSIPAGTIIRTTEVKLNGEVMTFNGGNDHFDYTVGENGKIEIQYYLTPNYGGKDNFDNRPATITSVEITFVVDPENAPAPAPVSYPITIGETGYETLQEAVDAAKPGDVITINEDITGNGVKFGKDGKGVDVTIDFGGHTYTVDKTVGSAGTETNGFQLLKESNSVTLKNGTLTDNTASILLQNYTNLTVEGMNLVSDNASYVVSNNNGSLTLKDYVDGDTTIPTNITANAEGAKAFDMYYWPKNGYDAINVTVNTTGTIKGDIEISADGSADFETATSKLALNLQAGTFDGEFVVNGESLNYEYKPEDEEPVNNNKPVALTTVNTDWAEGANKADDSVTFTGGRVTFKLPDVVKKDETVKILVKGTTDGAFRAYLSNAASLGANWNHSAQDNVTIKSGKITEYGEFEVTLELKANEDVQYLLLSTGRPDQLDDEDAFKSLTITGVEVVVEATPVEPTEEEVKAALYKALAEKTVTIADGTKFTDADVKLFFENPDEQTYDEAGNIVVGEKPAPVKSMRNEKGYTFLYVNDDYHAVLANGLFLPMPHVDDGNGICKFCWSEMVVEMPEVGDDEVTPVAE